MLGPEGPGSYIGFRAEGFILWGSYASNRCRGAGEYLIAVHFSEHDLHNGFFRKADTYAILCICFATFVLKPGREHKKLYIHIQGTLLRGTGTIYIIVSGELI